MAINLQNLYLCVPKQFRSRYSTYILEFVITVTSHQSARRPGQIP